MEKIWYQSYDPGVPHTVDPDQYVSLNALTDEACKKYGDKPAFINFGEKLTFRQLDKLSRAFAGYLQKECGLSKGDSIAFLMPNCLQYPIAIFGALRAGLIVVNLNPWYTRKEINKVLNTAGVKCIVFSNIYAAEVQYGIENSQVSHFICTELGDLLPLFKKLMVNWSVKYVKNLVKEYHIKNVVSFTDTILPQYVTEYRDVAIDSRDIAFLLYTEGRRYGRERCVMVTHRNVIANILQCTTWLESFFRYQHEEAMVNPFPLSRPICIISSLVMMRVGFATILITDPLNTHGFVAELKKTPFSVFYGVDALFSSLLKNDEFRHLNFSKLKFTGAGGTTVHRSTSEKWKELTGCHIQQGFGLVETTSVSMMPPISTRAYHTNIGLPIPSTDIKICDNEGKELGVGEMGELYIKGPHVCPGYWNDPEMTKSTFDEEGWLRTGDIVKIDEKGFLYLVDRLEDVMCKQGKNVYATHVENELSAIPGVQEVGVVGVLKPDGEHSIIAYVVRSDSTLTEETIVKFSQNRLESHEMPDQIAFTKMLPHSIAGFLLRGVLRDEAAREIGNNNNG